MSLIKYRVREVAADFGKTPKEITEIVGKYFEKPKSNTQVLTEQELNVVFEYMTRHNQSDSLEQAVASTGNAKPKPAKAENKPAQPSGNAAKPQQNAKPAAKPAAEAPKPQQSTQEEPQRKRERRVVDTSAVTVNADRFDDRVDSLISERAQNFSGGKQRIGNRGNNKQQQQK